MFLPLSASQLTLAELLRNLLLGTQLLGASAMPAMPQLLAILASGLKANYTGENVLSSSTNMVEIGPMDMN
jgi:hypothetical protein